MTAPDFNRPDNIHTALQFNTTTGLPELRVNMVEGSIEITGPITIPGTIEINNDAGNPIPVSANTTPNSNSNPIYVNLTNASLPVTQGTTPWVVSGSVTTILDGTNTDAFGRLRVSNPVTLFDSQSRYYDHGQFSSSTTGTATVSYNANQSSFTLSIGTANGDSIIRETTKVFPYQPGKSLLVMNTFCLNAPKTNLRQRVGFFGAQNGVFFEANGSTLNLVIRSYTSGVISENRIPQSDWNGDKLNGLGPSGITLDPASTQIFWTDIEWLGVGSVRCGFVINGQFYLCHTFNHANLGNTSVYMTTAILPVRYEITNTGVTSGASTLKQICSTVISEGGYNQYGPIETAGTGTNVFRCVNEDVYYPIVSIRLASGRLDSIVGPTQVDILSPSVNYYRWMLVKNGSLSGATWAGTSQTGTVQYDTAASGISGGTIVESGFASSRTVSTLQATYFQNQLGRTLAGVSDTYTLAIASTANNADVLAQLGWQELS